MRYFAGLHILVLAGAVAVTGFARAYDTEYTEVVLGKDMPQQFAWRHSAHLIGDLGGEEAAAPQTAGWGADLGGVELALDQTVAFERDQLLGGDALDSNSTLYVTLGDRAPWSGGVALTYNRHDVDGDIPLEQDSFALDLFAEYAATDRLSLGAFVNYTHNHLHETRFTIGGVPGKVGGRTNRLGAGAYVTVHGEIAGWQTALSTSLASMNKPDPSELWNTNYTSWASLLSATRPLTERLDLTLYATYVQLLEVPAYTHRDENFLGVGGEFGWRFSKVWSATCGYGRSLLYDGFEDHILHASVVAAW